MKLTHALFVCLSLIALPLRAADVNDLTYTTTGGEVTITDCDEAATGELVIPDTIEGNPVTSIEGSTFWGCSSLTNITIPDGVTRIGAAAFLRCSSLTSITIPESVTSIEGSTFAYCTSLTSITIPDSVTSIGDYAFYKCSSLTSITIPDNVISIGINAFRDCTSLTSIAIGNGVASIGEGAFNGCSILTDVTLPSGFSLRSMSSAFTDTPAQLSYQDSSEVTAMEEQIASLEAQLAAVTAERDVRPTLEELVDARAGSIVLVADRENNEVTLNFKVEETENLKQGTWRTVQGGDISLKVALEPGNKFMRIALGE